MAIQNKEAKKNVEGKKQQKKKKKKKKKKNHFQSTHYQ